MYKLYVAIRYLWRSWLNWVGVAAVAIAVCVPICVLSVMKGFDQEIRARSRDTLADLIVSPRSDDSFSGYRELMAKIERLPHVVSTAPEYAGIGIVQIGKQRRYALFRGIDLEREKASSDLLEYFRSARAEQARETLRWLLNMDAAGLDGADASVVQRLASSLRRKDFDRLPRVHREALAQAAKDKGVDLAASFAEADSAAPEWVKIDNPKKYAPALLGIELGVRGIGSMGEIVRLGKGEECLLIIPTSVKDSSRAFQRCRVSGYFKSGLYEYDERTIILPLDVLQRRLEKEGRVTSINVRLDDVAAAPEVRALMWGAPTAAELRRGVNLVRALVKREYPAMYAKMREELRYIEDNQYGGAGDALRQACFRLTRNILTIIEKALAGAAGREISADRLKEYGEFKEFCIARARGGFVRDFVVSTWQDKRRNLLRAVRVEQGVMAFILSFVSLVAGFLILSILHTTVLVKTKDIGILKSIGGSVGGILSLFLLNGVLIGLVGSVLGAAGGVYISMRLNDIENLLSEWFGFRLFPRDIYYLDSLPVDKHPVSSALMIAVCALAISVVASALPAWKASRMDAVETLRYE